MRRRWGGAAQRSPICAANGVAMLLMLLAFVGGKVPDAHSAEDCAREAARVVSVEGAVHLRRAHGETWRAAEPNVVLCAGDQVRVGARSRAALVLRNETTLRLDQSSTLTLRGGGLEGSSLLDLLSGALHVITRTPQPFKVKTPYVNAAVDGTEFLVDVRPDEARIAVYEGRVSASNEFGILSLIAGEIALVAKNQAPRKEIMVRPVDAVQWALYYPNIIDYRLDDATRGFAAAPALRESIDLYRQGRLAEAIFRTDHAPEGRSDARFLTYRAGLLLMVGRVDEAKPEIQHALTVDPHFSPALALNSVIAVVQNDKEQALTLATKAVEVDPSSPAARMALSYAQQAHFKIHEASASVHEALELEPNSALAWARLAELQMSSGELDLALESARRAVELDPAVAKTQSVLGFANLTRIDTKAAKQAFGKAIELDQAEPLARLGLGLAKIREGYLIAGREEIEIAVSLDPGNSLLRSYMGKAYYEERRDKLAGGQFELAKRYDPRDPTPWFYDAIREQTENRPVEALQDLEKSIELNDNRAVYRSRLLLDEDRAARSASLARIYGDLGFERLAVLEAAKSLNEDVANHSAHRFLSDAYARLDRHEIARVSELLQAQLLQPLNINPVQPRLAFPELNILSSLGPAESAYNEYFPLFERDRPRFAISALVGNHDTRGNEAVVSNVTGRLSYSFGQFHYQTDGFRANNDLKHDIYDLFAQFEITPQLNVQAEILSRDTDHGDLSLNFGPQSFSPRNRTSINQDTARLGARLSPSPGSNVLASIIHSNRDVRLDLFLSGFPDLHQRSEYEADLAEIQYILSWKKLQFLVGAGRTSVATNDLTIADYASIAGLPCPPRRVCQRLLEPTAKSTNQYLYSNLAVSPQLRATIGLSHDQYEDSSRNLNLRKWNPKLGLQWTPNEQLNVRLAGFKTLKRELITDQTVEPTNILGFNQFFDDLNGTRTKRLALGLDFHPTPSLYGGLEVSKRDLITPIGLRFVNQWEKLVDANVHLNVRSDVTLSLGYRRDRFTQEAGGITGSPTRLSTESVPIALRYFSSNRLFLLFTPTFVRQNVERPTGSVFPSGTEKFFIFNAAVGYRLPGRRGTLSLEVNNLFGEDFSFQDDSFRTSEARTPRYTPAREVLVRASLMF